MNWKQKGFITAGALLTLLLAMPFASTIWMKAMAAPMIYETVESAPATQLAVVLGAAAYNPHSISPVLQDRLETALELLKAKKVTKILITGAENEVIAMTNYVKEHGVHEDQFFRDAAGINTLASIQNIPNNYKKVTIVTQRFHLPRALFYARHRNLEAIGVNADRREYAKIYDFKKREVLATSKAWLEVLLGQFPLFDLF